MDKRDVPSPINTYVRWYIGRRPFYESLARKIKEIIEEVLVTEKMPYHKIEFRAKEINSFEKKIQNGISFNPQNMQDLAGIRIICNVNSDVEKISDIIKNLFDIDSERSVNKAKILGVDKVGYKSIHFVAKLPKERIMLPEFKIFDGLYFEIQVRTILQHAWAEIQHNNYKIRGILPDSIRRKTSLLAGLLEIADDQFDHITKLVEEYAEDVTKRTNMGDLDIPLNSTSLRQYLIDKFGDISKLIPLFGPDDSLSTEIVGELEILGIDTLKKLDGIMPPDFKNNMEKRIVDVEGINLAGIIRAILILHDADQYFSKAWKRKWTMMTDDVFLLMKDYGLDAIGIIRKHGVGLNSPMKI